jgi:hypothetical protein
LIEIEIDRKQPLVITGNRDPNEATPVQAHTTHQEEMLEHELNHGVKPSG